MAAPRAVLSEAVQLAGILLQTAYAVTLGACLPRRRSPPSPTLSAQEGELDNLLAEPNGGWDDDSISIAPRSTRYGKEALIAARQRSASNATHASGGTAHGEQDARELGEVNVETMRRTANWEAGVSMDELAREEAELAKMDPPAPTEEFGDFEQAQVGSELASTPQQPPGPGSM